MREQKKYKRHGTILRFQSCESSGRAAGPRIKNYQGFFQGFLLKIYGKQKRQGAFFLSSKHGRRYGFKSVCFIKKAIGGGCLFLWAVGCKGSFKGHCGFCGAGRLLFLPFFYFFVAFFFTVNVHASCSGFFCKGVGGWGGQKVIAVLWVVFYWCKTYSGAFLCRFVFYV